MSAAGKQPLAESQQVPVEAPPVLPAWPIGVLGLLGIVGALIYARRKSQPRKR